MSDVENGDLPEVASLSAVVVEQTPVVTEPVKAEAAGSTVRLDQADVAVARPAPEAKPVVDTKPTPVIPEEGRAPIPTTIEEREGLTMELEDKGLVGVSVNFTEERKTLDNSNDRKVFGYPMSSYGLPFADTMYNLLRNNSDFGENVQDLISNFAPQAIHSERLTVKGSDWAQSLQHAGERIGTAQPRLEVNGNVVKGQSALMLLRRATNLGTSLLKPLYHSCIYIEMSCPPDTDLINLDYRLAMERAAVGMSTAGLLLSATSTIFVRELAMFALNYVTSTNVVNLSGGMVNALMERIDPRDYPDLINTMLATMYPNGFPWIIECSNPKCGHKHHTRLHFSRLSWVDKSCLNQKQMDMLIKKRNAITDAELAEYKAEFKLTDQRIVKFDGGTEIHLKSTSLADYAEAGRMWVEDIERQQAVALSSYNTDAERKAFLDSHIQARAMRKYGHFVEQIVINADTDKPTYIRDPETIANSLDLLSASEDYFTHFQDKVIRFIEAGTISVIGYVAAPCEKCGEVDQTGEGRFKSIVPLPIDRIFFTLTRQKTSMLAMLEQAR